MAFIVFQHVRIYFYLEILHMFFTILTNCNSYSVLFFTPLFVQSSDAYQNFKNHIASLKQFFLKYRLY